MWIILYVYSRIQNETKPSQGEMDKGFQESSREGDDHCGHSPLLRSLLFNALLNRTPRSISKSEEMFLCDMTGN